MVSLAWSRPDSGQSPGSWWSFPHITRSFSLNGERGVYCIFQRTPRRYRTVWVGKGNIRAGLQISAAEPKVAARPYLLVTWAETDSAGIDGVHKYLIDELHPLVGETASAAEPIAVNLPFHV